MTHANDEIISLMPALAPKDVSAAVVYAISVKENVQVSEYKNNLLTDE
jgi:NADP-dependent 3-hydroxy acid dehydrogenase YdfG